MKERPIIFNGEMVRAILNGRKTQTRRPVKLPKRTERNGCGSRMIDGKTLEVYGDDNNNWRPAICPFGTPGDRLYVRETWQHKQFGLEAPEGYWYRADYTDEEALRLCWRPSIHMPKWASRITLEVTAVRVERVRDINEEDAKAEGVKGSKDAAEWFDVGPHEGAFHSLWDFIYAKDGLGWDANPWVWVVEFKRVTSI